ncbi:hypothetical protein NECAME_18535 [Necator americanus]|uniref:Uncharacterized protein n=1 Tax=Necator americanus TaxID=51031 RepID=W2SWL2_NECAM|nr:hypothetical protein NECAME_18535 [Necator americanus]ETN73087.1 hypothetical protein NECAME_18535 [Necator americanus]
MYEVRQLCNDKDVDFSEDRAEKRIIERMQQRLSEVSPACITEHNTFKNIVVDREGISVLCVPILRVMGL